MRPTAALVVPLVSALSGACSQAEPPSPPPAAAPAPASTVEGAAPAPTAEVAPAPTVPQADPAPVAPAPEQLGNPATVHCTKQGAKVEMVKVDGADRAVCVFDDGSRCEAWSFKRGECEKGSCRSTFGTCTQE